MTRGIERHTDSTAALLINKSMTNEKDVLYARIPGVGTAPVACGFLLFLLLVLVNGQGGTVASASHS